MNENLFKNVEVKIPKRSGFDKSFKNLFTMPVGTLVPLLCDEVIPNTKVHLKALISASLPPLATDTFMRCKIKCEAFFVPFRQLYGGFEAWLTKAPVYDSYGTQMLASAPILQITKAVANNYCKPGQLSDYLGLKFKSSDFDYLDDSDLINVNPYPFIAYHWIYDNWYRNTLVQKPAFIPPAQSDTSTRFSTLPWRVRAYNGENVFAPTNYNLFDGVSIYSLRQRNFGVDYFTSATPSPQLGDAQSVTVETSGDDSIVTISALRSANSLQQFCERNNLAGYRLVDYVKAHYGAHLTDGNANRPLYLGSGSLDVYNKGIYQTANDTTSSETSNNPFSTIASKYGDASCGGEISLIDNFTAEEPGLIFVMCSLVPKVTYSSGVLRQMKHYIKPGSQTDMANPLLQNVGNQPIYKYELIPTNARDGSGSTYEDAVFGYTQRYAEFMTRDDELHGLLRDGSSLSAFALQRYLGQDAVIGDNFLKIPNTYLDQVTAGDEAISNFGCWVDSYLDYKVSMPLNQFSIPSLQDPAYEHGDSKVIRRGGIRID